MHVSPVHEPRLFHLIVQLFCCLLGEFQLIVFQRRLETALLLPQESMAVLLGGRPRFEELAAASVLAAWRAGAAHAADRSLTDELGGAVDQVFQVACAREAEPASALSGRRAWPLQGSWWPPLVGLAAPANMAILYDLLLGLAGSCWS